MWYNVSECLWCCSCKEQTCGPMRCDCGRGFPFTRVFLQVLGVFSMDSVVLLWFNTQSSTASDSDGHSARSDWMKSWSLSADVLHSVISLNVQTAARRLSWNWFFSVSLRTKFLLRLLPLWFMGMFSSCREQRWASGQTCLSVSHQCCLMKVLLISDRWCDVRTLIAALFNDRELR